MVMMLLRVLESGVGRRASWPPLSLKVGCGVWASLPVPLSNGIGVASSAGAMPTEPPQAPVAQPESTPL